MGLVKGKSQTDIPSGHMPGDAVTEVWQIDLLYGDFNPYEEKELDLISILPGKSMHKKVHNKTC